MVSSSQHSLRVLFVSLLLLTIGVVYAQAQASHNNDKQTAAYISKLKSYNPQQLQDYVKNRHQRNPKKYSPQQLQQIQTLLKNSPKVHINEATPAEVNNRKYSSTLQAAPSELPASFRIPGEFDESQAVFMTWNYYSFNADTILVEPFDQGYYVEFTDTSITLAPVVEDLIDIYPDQSPYPLLWAELADEIQKEVPVWIMVHAAADTAILKSFMASINKPLTNYKFFIKQYCNAFWMRDCAPIGFYYGDDDKVGFLDQEYYSFRPADNNIPSFLGQALDYQVFPTTFESEGGNFMTDGHKKYITSTIVYESNGDNQGKGFIATDPISGVLYPDIEQKNPLSIPQCKDTMNKIYGGTGPVLQSLQCDGGTGHIDIYAKYIDDETIAVTEYPSVFNTSRFSDYARVQRNLDTMKAIKSTYNTPIRIVRMPLPTNDNGRYDSVTCTSYGNDARGFINGVFANKTYIFPSYSDANSGNNAGDEEAVRKYQEFLPIGYQAKPIDSRILTPLGGAIHCITMQIPSENPVYIRHQQLRGTLPYNGMPFAEIPINAEIRNHSGIATAEVMWRIQGTSTWNSAIMTPTNINTYIGAIPYNASNGKQTFEYYISVRTRNGKTRYQPLSAPSGYYTFTVDLTNSVDDVVDGATRSLYPNPATSELHARFDLRQETTASIQACDIHGNIVLELPEQQFTFGTNVLSLNVRSLPIGSYVLRMNTRYWSSTIGRFIKW